MVRTSDPSPARVGRKGTRHEAACRPRKNMPSSTSMTSTRPCWRAARQCGSSAMESSVTKPHTTLRTLPVAHSSPTSGPPYATTVRSVTSDRQMARTTAMGLRREPQPPMPMVMPERSSLTMSSTVVRLSDIRPSLRGVGVALLDEGGPLLVGYPAHMKLVGEALFVAIAALHVDGVDAVERLLGPADDRRALGGDVGGQLECGRMEALGRHHRGDRSIGRELRGRDRLR